MGASLKWLLPLLPIFPTTFGKQHTYAFHQPRPRTPRTDPYHQRFRLIAPSITPVAVAPPRVADDLEYRQNQDDVTRKEDLQKEATQMLEDNMLQYDDEAGEASAEFTALSRKFLQYTDADLQALTSTSTRYAGDGSIRKKSKRRTREEGIRFRALFSGVRAASLEPRVLRSFTVLFEDYLPIRLCGRRIYSQLSSIMDEVREERTGEIIRARHLCPEWSEDSVDHARQVWDSIVDEILLLDSNDGRIDECGVVTVEQLDYLGLVESRSTVEDLLQRIFMEEEGGVPRATKDASQHCHITFPVFAKLAYELDDHHCRTNTICRIEIIIQTISVDRSDEDLPRNLAEQAIKFGANCSKRQKHSDTFDGYVSEFQIWEQRYFDRGQVEGLSRRKEILLGCFVGARTIQVKLALKFVYVEYKALRLGGDLIFRLMRKVVNPN